MGLYAVLPKFMSGTRSGGLSMVCSDAVFELSQSSENNNIGISLLVYP